MAEAAGVANLLGQRMKVGPSPSPSPSPAEEPIVVSMPQPKNARNMEADGKWYQTTRNVNKGWTDMEERLAAYG